MDTASFVLWLVISTILVIGLFALLLYNAHKLVSFFQLENGFENDEVNFGNINSIQILRLGIVIIGGYLIVNNLPFFLSHAILWFSRDIVGNTYSGGDNLSLLSKLISMIVGYILIANNLWIATRLNAKSN
jgi:hypothetical protein